MKNRIWLTLVLEKQMIDPSAIVCQRITDFLLQTQDCYMRRREYQLLDSASYFLDKIDELTEESYLPELQDILR